MYFYDPLHILDVLPGVCSQVQHPKVLVVVELFPVWRGKLSPKHPELTPTLGNYHRLRGREGGVRQRGGRGLHKQSEIRRFDVCRFNWFSAEMTLLISSPDHCDSSLPPCDINEEPHS